MDGIRGRHAEERSASDIVAMSIHADLDADKNQCTSNDLVSRVGC